MAEGGARPARRRVVRVRDRGAGANTVGLAAARHRVLERAGWDVERDGLLGAPRIRVVAGEERHATIDRSLRLLGIGTASIERGRDRRRTARSTPSALVAALEAGSGGPTIVCVQAGNVNTGAFDDLAVACEVAHASRRVGARRRGVRAVGRGQPGARAPGRRRRARRLLGGRRAQVAQRAVRHGVRLLRRPDGARRVDVVHRGVPRRRRARGSCAATSDRPSPRAVPAGSLSWAALRELGRDGLAELVERCCALARRFAERLAAIDGVTVANDVVLNQVLVGFGDDERTDRVDRGRPARRHLLDGRHDLARPAADADLGLQLDDDRGRRRPFGRGDPVACSRRRRSATPGPGTMARCGRPAPRSAASSSSSSRPAWWRAASPGG